MNCNLGIRLPLTGAKIPTIGKRGFQIQRNPIPCNPRKGALSQKIPNSIHGTTGKVGFLTRNALFWGGGDFGDFGPCKGQMASQNLQCRE